MEDEILKINEKDNDLECDDIIDILYDKNSFMLKLFSGSVLPVTHPNYYDKRISISLIQSKIANTFSIEIEKDTYKISKEKISEIKSILWNNFPDLINFALKQGNETFVGGGTSLIIKMNSVTIIIDTNNINDDDKIFVSSIIEKIVNIIKE